MLTAPKRIRTLLCIVGSLLLMSGCVYSERIAFYRPTGEGKVQKDNRNVPRSMEYKFGTGSRLLFRTWRTAEKTQLEFLMTLKDSVTFQGDGVEVWCERGETLLLRPDIWREERTKDGVGYHRAHHWNAALPAQDYDSLNQRAPKGDVSTGQFWATVDLTRCTGEVLSLQLPSVTWSGGSHSFGKVTLAPEEKRFRWINPQVQ